MAGKVDLQAFHPNSGAFLIFNLPQADKPTAGHWWWPEKATVEKPQNDANKMDNTIRGKNGKV